MTVSLQRRCGACGAMHYLDQRIRVCPDSACGALLEWALKEDRKNSAPRYRRVVLDVEIIVEVPRESETPFVDAIKVWEGIKERTDACRRHCQLSGPRPISKIVGAKVLPDD